MVKHILATLLVLTLGLTGFAQSSAADESKTKLSQTVERSIKANFKDIFPNPANDQVFFDYAIPLNVKSANLVFRNVVGQTVREVELPKGDRRVEFSVSRMEPGVYFYSLEIDGNVLVTRRLVVK